ncbi:putative enzyme related to lactoylglutathione lyase [Amycolatopsis lexingtonensis]|uniref:Enzyme related to lactoylglutathione lyase n=2 Tax=Amycolatopsis lexingtonensis TaxID=218822 RepID=A0ABR9HQW5_9PSEU|nr:putative enzyme related to lactoylglutathione lyase [Amycolatopsis lexingtonensis]
MKSMIPKPVIINVPVDDVDTGIKFYEQFLGLTMARSLSYEVSFHAPVSSDGILLTVNKRHFPGEGVTVMFHVEDLDRALEDWKAAGGTVVAGPYDLPLPHRIREEFRDQFRDSPFYRGEAGDSMGRGASLNDPEGNRLGVVEFNRWAHATFALGEYARPVTADQLRDQQIALGRRIPATTQLFER